MTKISDLDDISLASEADKNNAKDSWVPVVQGGTTRRAKVRTLLDEAPSSTGGSGPSGYVQSDVLYGVPRKVELLSSVGSGYVNNEIYLCSHSAVAAPGGQSTNLESDFNSKLFVARGLSVKVKIQGTSDPYSGMLQSVQINTPGQMYKVGDILNVTRLVAKNGNNPSAFNATTMPLAQIKISEVDPFIVANVASHQSSSAAQQGMAGLYGEFNLGGSTNDACISNPAFTHPGSGGNNTPITPITYGSTSLSSNNGYVVHDDPGATLFYKDGTAFNGGSMMQGSPAWGAGDKTNYFHPGSRTAWVSPWVNIADSGTTQYSLKGYSMSVALPGSWHAVYINQIVYGNPVGHNNAQKGYTYPLSALKYSYPSDVLPVRGMGHGMPAYVNAPHGGVGVSVEGIKPVGTPRDWIFNQRSRQATGYSSSYDDLFYSINITPPSIWKYSFKPLTQTFASAKALLVDGTESDLEYSLREIVQLTAGANPGSVEYNGLYDSSESGKSRGVSNANNTIYGIREHGANAYGGSAYNQMISISTSFYLVPSANLLPEFQS